MIPIPPIVLSSASPTRETGNFEVDRPASSRSNIQATHPARGRRPVLCVSRDVESHILFSRITQRRQTVELLAADNGEEGTDIAVIRRPRMVVLDARLSDVDGETLVSTLRKRALAPSAPIAVLAHDGSPGQRARFIWAGASASFATPLNVAEIDRTVEPVLNVAG